VKPEACPAVSVFSQEYFIFILQGNSDSAKLLSACEKMISVYPNEPYPVEIVLLMELDKYKGR
jgi:hypothetical protein